MRSAPKRPDHPMHRAVVACIAVFGAATLAAGCGGGGSAPTTPTGHGGSTAAIAVVADQTITKGQFDRALRARATGVSPLSPATGATVPLDAPEFRRCAAATGRQLRAAGAKQTPARKALVKDCASRYQQARTQTTSSLIQQRWVLLQAKATGVKVPAAAVAAALKGLQQHPSAFKHRLAQSGLALADVRATLTAQLLAGQAARAAASKKAPTEKQVKAFYRAHPELFGKPATRTIDLVAVSTAKEAKNARQQLSKGTRVDRVIAGFPAAPGIHQGHFVVTGGDGQLAPKVDTAVFRARNGQLVGPIKAGDRYYVAAIRSARPAKVPPFAKVVVQARQQYIAERSAQAQTAFQVKLVATWRPKTKCAVGYVVPECGNAKAGTVTTG
jgi:parvulin-like peptidyl-prolyl isomerase